MNKEWDKHRFHERPNRKGAGLGAWGEESVRELGDAKGEARRSGKKINHARIVEPCTQKNSGLPDGHPPKSIKVVRWSSVTT